MNHLSVTHGLDNNSSLPPVQVARVHPPSFEQNLANVQGYIVSYDANRPGALDYALVAAGATGAMTRSGTGMSLVFPYKGRYYPASLVGKTKKFHEPTGRRVTTYHYAFMLKDAMPSDMQHFLPVVSKRLEPTGWQVILNPLNKGQITGSLRGSSYTVEQMRTLLAGILPNVSASSSTHTLVEWEY